jgi:hypothetical protein
MSAKRFNKRNTKSALVASPDVDFVRVRVIHTMPVLDVWAEAPPSDFPNYATGRSGAEDVQGLLAQGLSWPRPTGLVGHCEEKGEKS